MADEGDGEHWLYRFTPEEWLRAARSELGRAAAALGARQQRAGVAGARRAAGMAWNAVLARTRDETGYGRSYLDHLHALADDAAAPATVRLAARALLDAPLTSPLVTIGRQGDTSVARHAAHLVEYATALAAPTASA